MKREHIRLALLTALEPGTDYWAREIEKFGVEEVHAGLLAGRYDPIKFGRAIEKLQSFNIDSELQKISSAGAYLLTP